MPVLLISHLLNVPPLPLSPHFIPLPNHPIPNPHPSLFTLLPRQRLKAESFCHNNEAILNETSSSACPCGLEDYECAYGFESDDGGCVRSRHVVGEAERPMLCIGGKVYQVDDQKYRKIPG